MNLFSQDFDLSETKIDPGNPEFKKLAFTCPGPKSACVVKAGADRTPVLAGKSESQLGKPSTESSLPVSKIDPVSKVSWKYGKVFLEQCFTFTVVALNLGLEFLYVFLVW